MLLLLLPVIPIQHLFTPISAPSTRSPALTCVASCLPRYFRCYSPVAFPKKYDPEGAYVRRWLPQLRNFPKKYLYEPWLCPIADQKKV